MHFPFTGSLMKKIHIAILFAGFTFSVGIAQGTLSGNWMLGGGLGFMAEKNATTENWDRTLEASPLLIWYPVQSMGFGMDFSYRSFKSGGSTSRNYTFGPLIRYYISGGWFPQIQYIRGVENPGFSKRDISGFALGLGYTQAIRPHFGIEPLLTYNHIEERRFFLLKINLVGSF